MLELMDLAHCLSGLSRRGVKGVTPQPRVSALCFLLLTTRLWQMCGVMRFVAIRVPAGCIGASDHKSVASPAETADAKALLSCEGPSRDGSDRDKTPEQQPG